MWKSLFVTTGDLVVFMDADLLDWDTHFVPGLLGPLLTTERVQLVKGFYERPFLAGDVVAPYEGGRVTELVARPLIALHFPELTGVLQPLAGEWAVRRSLLESLSVPTGYAVEHRRAHRHRERAWGGGHRAGRPGPPGAPAPGAARPRGDGHAGLTAAMASRWTGGRRRPTLRHSHDHEVSLAAERPPARWVPGGRR